MQNRLDIIKWCQENKLTYNEFNKLVDYAAAQKPQWIDTLSDAGFVQLIRTYLHD